jgi:hypothetical protein
MTGVIEPVVELYCWHFLRHRICTENANPPPPSVEVWKNRRDGRAWRHASVFMTRALLMLPRQPFRGL